MVATGAHADTAHCAHDESVSCEKRERERTDGFVWEKDEKVLLDLIE